jgi:epoxide hydrolase-like predicted phosphatase
MGNIKAVIFDWGGVLIDDPAAALMRYCADALGVDVEEYKKAYWLFEADFALGKIAEKIFWEKICTELGVDKPQVSSLWEQAFASVYKPKEEMFELARRLRKNGLRTAVLSNTERPAVDFFRRQIYDMFDQVVFSCLEGVRKPDKKIYRIAVERLGVQADECVFIDDRIEYVEGAKMAGLKGILFNGLEKLKEELSQLGVKTE